MKKETRIFVWDQNTHKEKESKKISRIFIGKAEKIIYAKEKERFSD